MTRSVAKIEALMLECTDEEIQSFIDKIYDDFESRTCSNCKWRTPVSVCMCETSELYDCCVDNIHVFGCNQWEQK